MEKPYSSGKVLILGYGFAGIAAILAVYNAFVPIFLKDTFGLSSVATGTVMTIDNILALLLMPFLGALSDRTRTALGRRRPYIAVGAPVAVICFVFVPLVSSRGFLGLMMMVIILMNLAMAVFRTPAAALLPDLVPSSHRSQANGIINLMGGMGALSALFLSKPLYDAAAYLPFVAAGGLAATASLLVVILIKEEHPSEDAGKGVSLRESFTELKGNLTRVFKGDKSLLLLLMAIFIWFISFNAVETFFTSYAKFYLGVSESTGAFVFGLFALTLMVMAVPAGLLGARLGRRRSIFGGLILLTMAMTMALHYSTVTSLSLLFVLAGVGWALVNVNSLPMVFDMAPPGTEGGYTGLYYFFSQAASIAAPPLAGMSIDLFGYPALMIQSSGFLVVALLLMMGVRGGEAPREPPQ
jgi:Na+/melibiose symporter-like transporter